MASGRSTNMLVALVAQYCLLMFTGKPFCPFLTMLDLAILLFCFFAKIFQATLAKITKVTSFDIPLKKS